ncbi:MAG: flagellar hook-basal body protein [Fimbriimonadaceae bacterium]|nr:flagellar hook-basal body protein [Fimbriimonadaceae bacterium]
MPAERHGGMNRGIYATATGMMSAQRALEVNAHNLANLSTVGYKRQAVAFAESYERLLQADGGKGRVLGTLGSGAVEKGEFAVFEEGPLLMTGEPLNMAIRGTKGLFAVEEETPDLTGNRKISYTRNGTFITDEGGVLRTADGRAVLGSDLQPIQVPLGTVMVGIDGTITVDGRDVGQVGVFDGDFKEIGTGLWKSTNAQPIDMTDPNNSVQIKNGAVEGSNVQAVSVMLEMITLNRSFELSQRSIQQQDDMTGRLIQSLQDR